MVVTGGGGASRQCRPPLVAPHKHHKHTTINHNLLTQSTPSQPPHSHTSSVATNVDIVLPLPPDAIAPQSRCSQGSATYVPEKSAMVWSIKSFPGGKVRCAACAACVLLAAWLRAYAACGLLRRATHRLPCATILPHINTQTNQQQQNTPIQKQQTNQQTNQEYLLRVNFNLPSVEAEDEAHGKLPPIKVKFEIPYFTVSGLQVRYLKVIEKSGYQALPWVRYITTAGNYEIRMM